MLENTMYIMNGMTCPSHIFNIRFLKNTNASSNDVSSYESIKLVFDAFLYKNKINIRDMTINSCPEYKTQNKKDRSHNTTIDIEFNGVADIANNNMSTNENNIALTRIVHLATISFTSMIQLP